MYWLSVLLVIATTCLLAATLPRGQPNTQAGYGELLKSLIALWRDEPALRRATMIQGCLFGSFTAFWTILALQLSARDHLGAETAGLFGIAGVVGILFAPIAGKIADRHRPADLIAAGAFVMLASWLTFAAFGRVAGLIVGVIVLDSASRVRWCQTNRPGANVTSVANLAAELAAKQLQLLQELITNAAAFGVVADRFQVSSCPIGSPIRNPVCRPAESDGDSD